MQRAISSPAAQAHSGWDVGKIVAFTLFPAIPALAPIGYYAGATWVSPILILSLLPLLDVLLPPDRSTGALARRPALAAALRVVPLAYVVAWGASLVWALMLLRGASLTPGTAAGLLVSLGIGSAFATCAAHEMLHWPERLPRGAARLIMAAVAYGPFPIEHFHHHAAVGLREHGTTPALGQSVWSYLIQNVRHTFVSAWLIERERQRRTVASWLRNRFIQQVGLTIAIMAVFTAFAGLPGLLLFVAQAAWGIYTTEYVNYAQHYGLSRGSDDLINEGVSWSSNGFATNAVTLNITRHAEHHLNGRLRYYELNNIAGAPTLPAGYLALFIPAMVPPLWRALMDDRARSALSGHAAVTRNDA